MIRRSAALKKFPDRVAVGGDQHYPEPPLRPQCCEVGRSGNPVTGRVSGLVLQSAAFESVSASVSVVCRHLAVLVVVSAGRRISPFIFHLPKGGTFSFTAKYRAG